MRVLNPQFISYFAYSTYIFQIYISHQTPRLYRLISLFKSTFDLRPKIFLPPFLIIYALILIHVDFKSTLCLKSKIVPLYYLFLHMHSVSKPMPHSSCNLHHKQATYHYIICNLHHCIKFHVAIYIALFILNNFY